MDKNINVLYLINYAGGGGSEQYLKILVDHLPDINPMLCYNEEGLLVKEFNDRNIKCIQLNMKNPFDLSAAKKLAKICKENDIQIIHSNYLRENYIAVLSKLFGNKAKIVYTCHFNTYDSKIITMFNKIFYKKLDRIISISNETTKSLIASGSDRNKIELIYHGVLENDFMGPSDEYKNKFEVSDELVISSASRFSPEKGNEFFIRSLGELKRMIDTVDESDEDYNKIKNLKYKVLLANVGQTLEDCKTLVNILDLQDTVKFVGFLSDVDSLYKASDIYVTSSKSEGLGLATLESLNYG
ncbi:MAG: glycosyltransferase, partial [archaeon]|nr:glycosyltransferase [archaeon]